MPRRAGNVWERTGWDSSKQIFQTTVPCATINEVQLHALLRALAAKFGLTPREIVGSYLKRRAKGYTHLEISKSNSNERRTTDHNCGDNPYFIARILRPNDQPNRPAGATVSSNSIRSGRTR